MSLLQPGLSTFTLRAGRLELRPPALGHESDGTGHVVTHLDRHDELAGVARDSSQLAVHEAALGRVGRIERDRHRAQPGADDRVVPVAVVECPSGRRREEPEPARRAAWDRPSEPAHGAGRRSRPARTLSRCARSASRNAGRRTASGALGSARRCLSTPVRRSPSPTPPGGEARSARPRRTRTVPARRSPSCGPSDGRSPSSGAPRPAGRLRRPALAPCRESRRRRGRRARGSSMREGRCRHSPPCRSGTGRRRR